MNTVATKQQCLVLNNQGIDLLDQCCFRQAVQLFHEALQCLQQSSSSSDAAETCTSNQQQQQPERSIHPKEEHRLILQPLLLQTDGSLTTTTDTSSCSNKSSLSVLDLVLQEAPSSHVAFPICIQETSGNTIETGNNDQQYTKRQHAAIISHNLGIACYCLAQNEAEQEQRSMLSCARQCAQCASTWLLEELAHQDDHDNDVISIVSTAAGPSQAVSWHCLGLCAMNSWMQVLRETSKSCIKESMRQKQQQQSYDCYGILVDLRASAMEKRQQEEQKLEWFARQKNNTAAAA